MTTQNRATLMLSSLKKAVLEVSGSYRSRGSGYYDAPPVEDKTPLAQDLEEMIVSPLTTKDERDVLIDTLMVVGVLQRLKEEEWADRLKGRPANAQQQATTPDLQPAVTVSPKPQHHHGSPAASNLQTKKEMEETLTQRSRRREAGQLAITMLKVAIIKACHQSYWRDGAFYGIKYHSSDVDIDLERLEESSRTTEAEKAIFRVTRARVADVRAYLGGRPPTDWSSVDDLGWVRRLKGVFEGEVGEGREAGEALNAQKGGTETKAAASVEDDGDGFETQRVYGGSGGPPKR